MIILGFGGEEISLFAFIGILGVLIIVASVIAVFVEDMLGGREQVFGKD